jgi:riboflavin kinase/FMN adenylyltransferase
VVAGDQRGRTIGIPTANLQIPAGKLVPAVGVYASQVQAGGQPYAAAVNIGVRPTFDGQETQVHVEAHLLDFQGDLYGQELYLDLIDRLRGEQRFPSIDALVAQIRADIEKTRKIVAGL